LVAHRDRQVRDTVAQMRQALAPADHSKKGADSSTVANLFNLCSKILDMYPEEE
jgi:hypothetical protein